MKPALSSIDQGQQSSGRSWHAIEFFAGIGGLAAAAPEIDIRLALDIDATARTVYELNWPHAYRLAEIASVKLEWLIEAQANMWWMSPPCQPYTLRGAQRDAADRRSQALLHLLELLRNMPESDRPEAILLENVVGFVNSQCHRLVRDTLLRCGYLVHEIQLCPSQMHWPNRRPRFYVVARREQNIQWRPLPKFTGITMPGLIDGVVIDLAQCAVEPSVAKRFGRAMHRVMEKDADAMTACFGSSYGKSILHAGSYLVTENGQWRRFAPLEVARLLGFANSFQLSPALSYRRCWSLVGNSLSIPAVRYLLGHL